MQVFNSLFRKHYFFGLFVGLVVWLLWLFIRYEEKKWVPKDGKAKLPPRVSEEKASRSRPIAECSSQHGYAKHIECFSKEQKSTHPSTANNSISQKVEYCSFFNFPSSN